MALKSFKIVGLLCAGVYGCSGDAFTSVDDGQPDSGGGSGGSAVGGDGGVGGSGGGSAGSGGAIGGTGGSGTGGSSTGGSGGRAGSSGSTEIWASDYDQGCTFDSECALVAEGDQCGCTGCANAAISSSAVGDWEEDASNFQCSPGGPTCEPACAEMLAACANAKCTVRPPLFIEGSNYDATCIADSDCRIIYTGEVCSACRCGTAAINAGAYEQYLGDIEGVVCAPGPSPCDGAPLEMVHCVVDPTGGGMGTCTVGL